MPDRKKSFHINDFNKKNMLFCKIIRAEISRGEIKSIVYPEDTGNCSVFRTENIPGNNFISVSNDRIPLLAERKINYYGEPAGLVYGTDEKCLEEFIKKIQIEYNKETSLEMNNYGKDQIIRERRFSKGDPERIFINSKTTEEKYIIPSKSIYSCDNQGAFSEFEENILTVNTSTQWPYHVLNSVCNCSGINKKKLNVIVPDICEQNNNKIYYPSLLAVYAALITQKTGKPVKIILNKETEESILKRPEMVINCKTAFTDSHGLAALRIGIDIDIGAYPFFLDEIENRISTMISGLYKCRNTAIVLRFIKTSNPPSPALAGMGFPEIFFALETCLAKKIGDISIDPVHWKIENSAVKNEEVYSAILNDISVISGFHRKYAAYEVLRNNRITKNAYPPVKGIGLSIGYQCNGFYNEGKDREPYSVIVKLSRGGILEILTSGISNESGSLQVWRDMACDILGIKKDNIVIGKNGTTSFPDTGPSFLSRNITIITGLILKCCNAVKKKRFRSPLPIEVKRSLKLPESSNPFYSESSGAAVVEINYNPVTYLFDIKNIWMNIYCGKLYSVSLAKKRVEKGIFNSLEWCLKNGNPIYPAENLFYSIMKKLPSIHITFLDKKGKNLPGGLEELPFNTIPPALTSAVSQAANVSINRLPITPELIFRNGSSK